MKQRSSIVVSTHQSIRQQPNRINSQSIIASFELTCQAHCCMATRGVKGYDGVAARAAVPPRTCRATRGWVLHPANNWNACGRNSNNNFNTQHSTATKPGVKLKQQATENTTLPFDVKQMMHHHHHHHHHHRSRAELTTQQAGRANRSLTLEA